jgi:hypothetical protein
MRFNVIVSATGLIAGAAASAVTYTTLTATSTATVSATRIGTRLTAAGVRIILGPVAAATVEAIGADMVAPAIDTTGRLTAAATSAAVGALVVATVSLLGIASAFAYRTAIRALRGRQPIQVLEARIVDDRVHDCWVVETLQPDRMEPQNL